VWALPNFKKKSRNRKKKKEKEIQNYAKGMLTIDNGEKRVDGNWFGKH
jgi:hypothetical protein